MLTRDPIKTSNAFGALHAGAAATPRATHSVASSDDAKKKKKKKKKATTAAATNGNGGQGESGNQDSNHETVQLPLPRRLEIAASHSDIHAALVGLVGWSRLSIHTDAIMVFFQSDALRLLLLNILNVRPRHEAVYENLVTLLANCLAVERDDKKAASHRAVATAVVATLRQLMTQVPPSGEDKTSDKADAMEEMIAGYLSKLVLKHLMSLSGVVAESTLSNEVLRIETQLKAAAMKDSEVKGQTIRDSFQRRDIRSDALVLYESRLDKLMQFMRESSSSKDAVLAADGGFLKFASEGSEGQLQVNDEELTRIKSLLGELEDEKNLKIEAIEAKKQVQRERLTLLEQERAELEAKLRAVNEQISAVQNEQELLQSESAAIEAACTESTSQISEQHKQVLQAYQQKERRQQVHAEFAKLETSILTISLAHSKVRSTLDKHVVCLRQQLEGALRYFASELPCVKFMVNRIEETQTEMRKLEQEKASYEALGVHAVTKELTEKVEVMRVHLEEDKQCVEALRKRDMEVVDMMECIFSDEQHQSAIDQLDDHLKKEAHRHIEYVRKVHFDAEASVSASGTVKTSGAGEEQGAEE